MKRFVFFLGFAAILMIPLKTEAGWSRNLEGYGSCVRQTSDGGYIIAGSITITDTAISCLIKTDELGNTTWTKTYGKGYLDWVEQTGDAGYVAAGRGDLIRTDNNGDVIWRNNYDSVSYDGLIYNGHILCVQETSDSGYIVSGHLWRNTEYGGVEYIWFLKTSSKGDSLWAGTYGLGGWVTLCSSRQIAEVQDGYIILGYGQFDLDGKAVTRLIKIDGKGDTLWSSDFEERAFSMTKTAENGFILTGQNNDEDLLIACLDSLGAEQWEKTYGDQGYDDGWSISTADDGCFIVTGEKYNPSNFNGDVWLLKLDSLGDTLWTRTFGFDTLDYGCCVRQTSDAGSIMLATSLAFPANKGIWLIKTDSLGLLGISEPVTPVTHQPSSPSSPSSEIEIASSIGSEVALRYSNCPKGFHASVYDAGGRRVDEIKSAAASGTIRWGRGREPGCYFIVAQGGNTRPAKVVIVR